MKKKVFVGLSGGVDSAVSAALLIKAGFDVTGVFIRIMIDGYPCSAVADRQDAMRVAAHLRIPYREIDLSREYTEKVFSQMLHEFSLGYTPNPDALCNREIKFGLFYDYARKEGADKIATGHYATIQTHNEVSELFMAKDPAKDQSYFLWMVGQEQLAHTLFPIGNLYKSEVRTLAEKLGLPNANRKDSQGLCFLGNISMHDMLSKELPHSEGLVLTPEGKKIGIHEGAALYTLGQRHGFTVTNYSQADKQRLYVIDKNIAQNTITVSDNALPEGAGQTLIHLREINVIGIPQKQDIRARYRYRQVLLRGIFNQAEKTVVLQASRFVPIGQSLVLYDAQRCLGGGIVDKSTVL